MRVSTKHVFPFQCRITYCLFNSIFPFVYVTHAFLEVCISDKGKEDSDDGIYTPRILHTSSIACEAQWWFQFGERANEQ